MRATRALSVPALCAVWGACTITPPPAVTPGLASRPGAAESPSVPESDEPAVGALVMAHGGSDEWNATVEAAVAPLAEELPTELALGMADPVTLQAAVDRLEAVGVERIAVIRLFISGHSFLQRTEYLFGERDERPARHGHGAGDELRPLRVESEVAIDRAGLVDARETEEILLERALALSRDPGQEAVLLIGHGNGSESVNDALLRSMRARASRLRDSGFAEVAVVTLREDWAEPRAEAEARIRDWVATRSDGGLRVLVIPFRLSGFGPYAEVIAGLDYDASGLGLLPHESITDWLRGRARAVSCASGWSVTGSACPFAVEQETSSRTR